jgi:hypothetical protein
MNKSTRIDRSVGKQERGSALVMAVFVLALLTAMGGALLFLSQTEIKMSEASVNPKKAFYYAEAGLEHARQALWLNAGAGPFAPFLVLATGGDPLDPIGFDPDNIAAVYDSNGNVTGFSGYDNDTPLVGIQNLDDGWYAAFMTNDLGEGRTNQLDSDDRVILAGVGAGPDGSFEVIEAVISIESALPSMPPATIFMLGPTPAFASGTSSVKNYIGDDCGVAGGDYFPVVGTIGSAAELAAEAGIDGNPTYTSDGPQPAPEDTFSDLTGSPVDSMNDPTFSLDPEWQSCEALHDMVESLRAIATVTCPDRSSYGSCAGSTPNTMSRIIFADGDFDVGPGGPKNGTLIVTGTMILRGQTEWEGLLLAVGEGVVRYNGAGNGHTLGGIVVADVAGPDGIYGNADDCTGPDDGFGVATYDERGGGNSGTVFCSTILQAADPVLPYDILEFRQH